MNARLTLPLALAAVLAHGQTAPTGLELTAKPSQTEVGVGETFYVELQAEGPAGTSWTFPTEAGDEHVELRAAPPSPAPSPAAPADRLRYAASVFVLKDAVLPAVTARYRLADGTEGELQSKPVPLSVRSSLPREQDQQTLADVRPPQALSVGAAFWIAVAVLVLAIVALVIWWLRRARRAQPLPLAARPEIPAHTAALQALQALQARGLLQEGAYRAYYIELVAIAKRYLERRLSAPVLEMTTVETTAFLREHATANTFAQPLRELASAADQIKFARGEGQVAEGTRHAQVVAELVEGLEARLSAQQAQQPKDPTTGAAADGTQRPQAARR